MKARYTITRCPGCGRMVGVNGSTCKPAKPAAPDAARPPAQPASGQKATA